MTDPNKAADKSTKFTNADVMKMLDANPDGFLSRMFFAALQGVATDADYTQRQTVEVALSICGAFMDIDVERRARELEARDD